MRVHDTLLLCELDFLELLQQLELLEWYENKSIQTNLHVPKPETLLHFRPMNKWILELLENINNKVIENFDEW